MKIALLTIWHEYNYGAELQAYATIKILKELGLDVEMINIRLSDQKPFSVKRTAVNAILSLSPCHRKFNSFWRNNIPTTRRYRSLQEIKKNPPLADIYMVGSDQVWNPDITKKYAMLYFLDFGLSNTKRISFASSFGVLNWTHHQLTGKIKKCLQQFDTCTCRESSGVEILKQHFSIDAKRVIDPTLLSNNYEELTGPIKEHKTLVYYPLSHDAELESFAQVLGKELSLIPLNINKKTFLFRNLVWNRPRVEQWVKNIAEAQFVITRSFHGLTFSLLYKRQFAILAVRNDRTVRILNLLEELGLQDRFFSSIDEMKRIRPWEQTIDYDVIDGKLQALRDASIVSLNDMLSK